MTDDLDSQQSVIIPAQKLLQPCNLTRRTRKQHLTTDMQKRFRFFEVVAYITLNIFAAAKGFTSFNAFRVVVYDIPFAVEPRTENNAACLNDALGQKRKDAARRAFHANVLILIFCGVHRLRFLRRRLIYHRAHLFAEPAIYTSRRIDMRIFEPLVVR